MTEFAPKSQFCGGKSTFDERLAVRRVAPVPEADGQGVAEHEEAHLGQDQCTRRVSFPTNLEGNVTTFAPHKALKLTLWGKLTFDETLAVHRVAGLPESDGEGMMRLVSVRISDGTLNCQSSNEQVTSSTAHSLTHSHTLGALNCQFSQEQATSFSGGIQPSNRCSCPPSLFPEQLCLGILEEWVFLMSEELYRSGEFQVPPPSLPRAVALSSTARGAQFRDRRLNCQSAATVRSTAN